ncbi:hypothetical protein A3J13_02670 [Candidatus Daviesbacteria bacterium RIFCSPLOWO2_02_FULL_36_8]|uniref:POTRA domain-containing protein n=1 Tax=Candidatus Daviesbacteria bacterium RIFCSPLOWO2_02_FULL_36_8 TaxID=1797793 RepID=A0A1F5MGM6_9BACT|nr:MAG: hypothetical protein A3J13_02670 [Candidatus Daviesbacteria bacterium RIFCSPLOWO2_02_FULL_36_8]
MRWVSKRGKIKSKTRILKIFLSILIIFFILLSFFGLIVKSNIFTIKSINIELRKTDCATGEQIQNSSNLLGQTIFFINPSKTESILRKKFICIKNIDIKRKFTDKINLSVFGREPSAILVLLKNSEATPTGELEDFSNKSKTESSSSAESSPSANFNFSINPTSDNFVVDDEGMIYSSNIENLNVPMIYINGININVGQKISGGVIENLLKIFEKMKIFGIVVKNAKMYSEELFLINAEPRIIFKMDKNIDIQIASLQLILNKAKIDNESIEFIDLRFDKPIIRIAPKKK